MKEPSRRDLQLERIKRSLEGGTYAVDPQKVAAAILNRGLERIRANAN